MAGEHLAAWWLTTQGMTILDRNLEIEGGEIDLLAVDHGRRVAVEVRAISGAGDPIDAIDRGKRRHVGALARSLGAARVDLVGLAFRNGGVEVHYVPG